ncbi:MAG: NAD(+) synthase [Selenomonadaceae bacterium]|nr:NAD(+) synthase [Selenomonadaceae bacterium]
MKIAYAQMKIAAGHPDVNTKKILQLIDKAQKGKADVVIFPEMAVAGLMIGNTWQQESFIEDCWEYGEDIILASKKNLTVVFGNIELSDDSGFNAIFSARNKRLTCTPVDAGLSRYADDSDNYFSFIIKGKRYNVGCIFNNENFHFKGKMDFCINFYSEPFSIDRDFFFNSPGCPTIRIGLTGIQNTGKTIHSFNGGSAVFNSRGEVVQLTEPFEECLNFVELEEIDKMPALELPEVSETEKIYRAISFGVKEFLEQIGIKKVVIGVSGGIDSAVAAALYTQAVGAENVILVNMPSVFNSATTKGLSEQLAKNLGCKYYVVPIQESVDWTVKQLEERGIEVSNFVKENIQARDRSARILAAIAASVGGVFTCNANKAETTVGYATLYGDEAGFLSALADLWKYQVYDLARYMNEKIYKFEAIPQGIIDIVPSAELSTAQNVDEGKGDPLKYPYHDYLLRAFAEDNLTPEDILGWYVSSQVEDNIGCENGLVEKYFPTAQDFIADLERWWKQFMGMGVAKRIQSPPILAVTDEPYGVEQESQNCLHFTRAYLELKERLLAN